MTHTVYLQSEDRVNLVLPDGRIVDIMLSHLDDDALPELDMGFPCDMVANCYTEHLKPAPSVDGMENVRLIRQIVVPIEKE